MMSSANNATQRLFGFLWMNMPPPSCFFFLLCLDPGPRLC